MPLPIPDIAKKIAAEKRDQAIKAVPAILDEVNKAGLEANVNPTNYNVFQEKMGEGPEHSEMLSGIMDDYKAPVDPLAKKIADELKKPSDDPDYDWDYIGTIYPSDERVKDINHVRELIRTNKKLTVGDVKRMIKAFGSPGKDIDNGDVLDGYIKFIKNYSYHYKPEAHKLDPNIDVSQKHIGPMAQDIEAVNPACVITDGKTGYKSVDTGRLALMNAGAIAELARRLSHNDKK